jgi:hypothetical protein
MAAQVPVAHSECGEVGSDDPVTGKPQCILMRQVTHTGAQAKSDTIFDSKVNPYGKEEEKEPFENPTQLDRLVFLSYVLFFLILTCIAIIFISKLSGIRKNTILIFAFILILLLALLQKRDGTI